MTTSILVRSCLALLPLLPIAAADWPQLQCDGARTGRTMASVAAPYCARWIWLGPTQTLTNTGHVNGTTNWPGDAAMPASVPFTIADSAQPICVGGRVFIGTQEGGIYAIDGATGATVWSGSLPGGTAQAGAAVGGRVVFVSLSGVVAAWDRQATGSAMPVWTYDCGRAATCAPLVVGDRVVVADHAGQVHALDGASGQALWTVMLSAPVYGGLCSDGSSVYVGTEDMRVHGIALADQAVRSSPSLRGQSFRMCWPVFAQGIVWAHACCTPIIGSEYVMEDLMTAAEGAAPADWRTNAASRNAAIADEESRIATWLAGGGSHAEASPDWRHLFALKLSDLTEDFVPLTGPVDGVGVAAHPVVLDNSGRVLTYFKTAFGTLTINREWGTFGTRHDIDICAIDTATQKGHRIPLPATTAPTEPYPWETDNLYGMSIGGGTLWLRQNFRGTQAIDLGTFTSRKVSVCVRVRDGGTFNMYDICYRQDSQGESNGAPGPGQGTDTPSSKMLGRIAPAIADVGSSTCVFIAENFGVTCIEHKP